MDSRKQDFFRLISRECHDGLDQQVAVECIETHISWVYLTKSQVFKIKKPVTFDFLDFSSLSLRLQACRNEVRLNSRLAPDTYLGVFAIYSDGRGQLSLEPNGEPIEYGVKMRRLDQGRMMDTLISNNAFGQEELAALQTVLEKFFQQQSPLELSSDEFLAEVLSHTQGNRCILFELSDALGLDHDVLARIHSAQLSFLWLNRAWLESRLNNGFMIDGHGDLRPEHICLENPVAIFDCIEFNDRFRWVDKVDELCFLAIECEKLARKDIGDAVIQSYLLSSQDPAPQSLISFYKSYRACIRAKVEGLSIQAMEVGADRRQKLQSMKHYLDLAEFYSQDFMPQYTVVIGGFMGTGKSTLSRKLAKQTGWEHLNTDKIRKEVFGTSASSLSFGQGIYHPTHQHEIYQRLADKLQQKLDAGLSVIVDASFTRQSDLDLIKNVLAKHRGRALYLWCDCPIAEAKERVAKRRAAGQDPSEARSDLVEMQRDLVPEEWPEIFDRTMDTRRPLDWQVGLLRDALLSIGHSTV
jgi:aminoglycoside phosphotransferase family enzyme/predicted kinase